MTMNQDLMVFIQETIYLKNKGWGIRDKPWWICNVGTHWIALFCNKGEIVYFDSFGVEHVPEKTKKSIGHKT